MKLTKLDLFAPVWFGIGLYMAVHGIISWSVFWFVFLSHVSLTFDLRR